MVVCKKITFAWVDFCTCYINLKSIFFLGYEEECREKVLSICNSFDSSKEGRELIEEVSSFFSFFYEVKEFIKFFCENGVS